MLKQDDPPPQTLFRVVVRQSDLVAVNVTLTHPRASAKIEK